MTGGHRVSWLALLGWVAGLLALLLALRVQRNHHLFQYLFFLRFPLIAAAVLVLFPYAATQWAPSLLLNLFAVDRWGLLLVTLLATFASWAVMYASTLIAENGRRWFVLGWKKRPDEAERGGGAAGPESAGRRSRRHPAIRRLLAFFKGHPSFPFALLALPLVATAVRQSPLPAREGALWALAGFAAAWGLLGLWRLTIHSRPVSLLKAPGNLAPILEGSAIGRRIIREYLGPKASTFTHTRAFVLFSLTLVVYLLGRELLDPAAPHYWTDSVPALAYLLLLLILLGWFLPAVSFFFDRFRIPTVLLLVSLAIFFYFVSDTDHYFELMEPDAGRSLLEPEEVVRSWARLRPEDDFPGGVVVTASGGGITAAYWTARVLTGLEEESDLQGRFSGSILLVSSVSGGGVGAMYFVDRYRKEGGPPQEALESIRHAAGSSSLSASAWGLVYPDFWRAFLSPVFLLGGDVLRDRAWALERSWGRFLSSPEVTLGSWGDGIAEGWRPAQIFNATITETGERFLLTPAVDLSSVAPGAQTFWGTFPGQDLAVITAARLSATYPYVTPIARAGRNGVPVEPGYHIADGGYYDNFGVVSALEWLDAALPVLCPERRKCRILLIQIRAAGSTLAVPRERRGWLYATVGPLLTLLKVRTSSQMFRNDFEIRLAAENWRRRDVDFESVVFELEAEAPLSWHLSETEKEDIDRSWNSPRNRESVEKVRQVLNR